METNKENDKMFARLMAWKKNDKKGFALFRIGEFFSNPKRNEANKHLKESRERLNSIMKRYDLKWGDVVSYCRAERIDYRWILA